MRVLIMSYETPCYPGGGGPSRLHSLLEPLAGRHQIRVVSTGGEPEFGRLPHGVDIQLIDPGEPWSPPPGPWLRRNLSHYLGGRPWLHQLASHHTQALAEALPDELETFKPDLVQFGHGELGPLLALMPARIPTVLVMNDLLHSIQAQAFRHGFSSQRMRAALEVGLIVLHERRDMMKATSTVVVTEADRQQARRLAPRARLTVVPNCVDVEYFRRQGEVSEVPSIVMTASFHYQPNIVAGYELLTEVLPRVRARVPDAEVVLAGQHFDSELARTAAATSGVRVVEQPDDLRPLLWRSWVAAVPLRVGSGSPLKVAEAMAAGVPVVATHRACDAVGVGADDGVLCAGDPGDFANRLIDVLTDAAFRNRLSERAVAAALRFDRGPAAAKLEGVWASALEAA